ncbi:MAG: ATPase, T2SS/T4P/T4SS family [Acetatifactor sp.]|nr:ATPase, T2SS/T4P/T4SS family [Acetatifactor sp.]
MPLRDDVQDKDRLPVLQELVNDYITQKQSVLLQVKKGQMSREDFMEEVKHHVEHYYELSRAQKQALLDEFEQYVFGYSILSPLIDDPEVSDIRVVSYDNIRVKRKGVRMDSGVSFSGPKEYRQFVDYVATKNQVNISNLNAIQRFTDQDSHPDFILRFTVSMPLVNTIQEPYLCIRKVPKSFPQMGELIRREMLDRDTAELLVQRFREGSTLICGGNSSGKTTLLNALKETLPDDMAVLVIQQADELTTRFHPDMMFLHSLPGTGESRVNYDLKDISIAGLTMDVDFFIIGEVKGAEAMYLLNAAYTGQICAATIHAPSADRAPDKLVDYAMYESRYSRDELMKMMDCFHTLIFMEHYKVKQIFSCEGYSREQKSLLYKKLYQGGGR